MIETLGTFEGEIIDNERGENGFGYDSIFYVKSLGKCVAELSDEKKNEISHRHNALEKLIKILFGEYR